MNYSDKYSICFQPSAQLIEEIKALKLELGDHIGWYNSKNSLAHLTIAEFQNSESNIEIIHKQLNRIIASFDPVQVILDSFDTFPNGTFFLKVDEMAHEVLKGYVKQITQVIQLKNAYICTTPHLTIGRKLDAPKIQTAFEVLKKPNLTFECNHIALRRLNIDRRQFDIIQTYPFLAHESQEPIQLALF